jgi:hypothetical protein
VKDKINFLQASFDFSNSVISIDARQDIELSIDSKNYYIISKGKRVSLFEKYVEDGIMTKEGIFSSELFASITTEFFLFVGSMNIELPNRVLSLDFSIYVLPSCSSNSAIEYQTKRSEKSSSIDNFTDSFGNLATGYAFNSTKIAKFLSFYEKAFTINCKKNKAFYQNMGIGQESLPHIYLPADQTFDIGGLKWVFINLSDVRQGFRETRRGILSQLSENFQLLSSQGQTKSEKSLLKVVCFRSQQAKLEILIDDNLTMDRMRRLFSQFDPVKIPFLGLEVLIYKDKKTILWDDYIYSIRGFLSESAIPKPRLVMSFQRILKRNISDWLRPNNKKREEAIDFFKKADFCLKTLSTSKTGEADMNVGESFAYNIGIIARLYVNFKEMAEEESNSLRDILTYTKYDREKLRFVYSRIGLGINLSKAKEQDKTEFKKVVSRYTPHEEIPQSEAFNNYSYFFYKGYFQGESDNR